MDVIQDHHKVKAGTFTLLALQHLLAMFGATILVPLLTGLDPSLALMGAGFGTLLFHLVTKRVVPVFLGSSFAFIPVIAAVLNDYGMAPLKGAIFFVGFIYLIFALAIKLIGKEKILALFPPLIIAPIIISIGLRLVPVAVGMVGLQDESLDSGKMLVMSVTVLCFIIFSVWKKTRAFSLIIAILTSYLLSLSLGMVDLKPLHEAAWFGLSERSIKDLTTLPSFELNALLLIFPVSFVVLFEHVGDISASSSVVGKNFMKDPGLNRTVLGDGLATMCAGLLGAPCNTTYGENTGVLAMTKVYKPSILRLTAVFAIVLSVFSKFTAFIGTVPVVTMGSISLMVFSIISVIGIRVLVNSKIDLNCSKNLALLAIILALGIGVDNIQVAGITISGLTLALVSGVVLNAILNLRGK